MGRALAATGPFLAVTAGTFRSGLVLHGVLA
jgi:hypothetical protein